MPCFSSRMKLCPSPRIRSWRTPMAWAFMPSMAPVSAAVSPWATWVEEPSTITGSAATDVTGGMADKVRQALAMARAVPGLQVRVFSGAEPGALQAALMGEAVGTLIVPE